MLRKPIMNGVWCTVMDRVRTEMRSIFACDLFSGYESISNSIA